MSRSLSEQAAELPTEPGVYLFKDRRGKVLYVGKAINLRVRVRQYLNGHDERRMVPFLVHRASTLEVMVTRTEKEALLLENNLIKQHRPRFNIRLVDDKNFLHLRIDPKGFWPRYTLTRRVRNDGARYFGPFHAATKARETLSFLERSFPLRTCSDRVLRNRKRPCLLHQMNRCDAPCVDAVTKAAYDEHVRESMLLLEGKRRTLVRVLKRRMAAASDSLLRASHSRPLKPSVTILRQPGTSVATTGSPMAPASRILRGIPSR